MKMYTGAESSKETQHITPHIAAHKSSLAPTSSVSTLSSVGLTDSRAPHDLALPHLANKGGLHTHIPTYKVGMHPPHPSVVKGLDHDGPMYLARHGHSGHSSLPSQHSKSIPQDLSAHATAGSEKAVPLELTPHSTSHHHKPLPHIHTVVSPSISGNQLGTLIPAHQTDRGSYFRMPDSVISVQGPAAVLVSTVGEGGVSSNHHGSQTTTLVHAQSSMSAHSSATNLTTMPPVSLAATISLPGGISSAGNMTHNHLMSNECIAAPNVTSGCAVPEADLRGVKKEKVDQLEGMGLAGGSQQVAGPQRDLVRQALQAVVTNPQHKTGNDQEVIEYNYTAGDIAELLMMNIQVNASLQAINKGGVPPETGTGQVVVLQPAAVDDTNSLPQQPLTPKRRRPKLSEEAQVERRVRIAMRMREKRAEESDDQKRLRRIREAERMRHKRATEDAETKRLRRDEAANRARSRRACMSIEDRIIDRQKAAERMRLRRATESDEAKTIRRLKAAERMRKRRATETPEQRSVRRQKIAIRMKARRKCKSEDGINGDEPEVISRSLSTRFGKANSVTNNITSPESSEPVTSVNPEHTSHISASQLVSSSSHIFVPSTVGVGGGIALLQVDPTLSQMPIPHTSELSTVDMTHLVQPISLQKSATTTQEQEMPEPLSLQKHVVVSQQSSSAATPTSESLSTMTTTSHGALEPLPLHKGTSYHHHLPHLLHYHQPHASTQQQHPNHHHHSHHHHPHHHHHHHHLQQRHQQQ